MTRSFQMATQDCIKSKRKTDQDKLNGISTWDLQQPSKEVWKKDYIKERNQHNFKYSSFP